MTSATSRGTHPGRAWRLFVARTLAWTLLFAGWLGLGALGLRHAPAGMGALAPVALALLTLGLATRAATTLVLLPWALRATLVAAGAVAGAALHALTHGVTAALWVAAIAWAVLLLAASRVVRGLRSVGGPRPPSPVGSASAGALLAWAAAGDPLAVAASPAALGAGAVVVTLVLAAVVPGRDPASRTSPGCRSGLFDCALAWPALDQWRDAADWPWRVASLAMLPMMASLPLLAEGCAQAGWPASAVTAGHLLAMLAPAAVVAMLPVSAGSLAALRPVVAGLLVGGGLIAWLQPGTVGLMTAMALHAVAWSLGWATTRSPTAPRDAMPRCGPGSSAAASAATVLVLGALHAADGPAAWAGVHVALGALAAAGLSIRSWRHLRPATEEGAR